MSKDIRIRRTIVIIAASVLLLVTLTTSFVLDPFEDQIRRYPNGGLSDFINTSYYKINPETITLSLDRGESNVFLPELATPQAPIVEGPFMWHQSDYLRIAIALHQFVWNESLNSWNLYSLQLEANCQDNSRGFRQADFIFFRKIIINGKIKYSTREILVTPEVGEVSVGGGANFPRPLLGWKSINLDTKKLSADDALQIAEQNGGQEFRSNVNNNCNIHVNMNPNVDRADWLIFYSSNDGSSFEIYIDPYTGKLVK